MKTTTLECKHCGAAVEPGEDVGTCEVCGYQTCPSCMGDALEVHADCSEGDD